MSVTVEGGGAVGVRRGGVEAGGGGGGGEGLGAGGRIEVDGAVGGRGVFSFERFGLALDVAEAAFDAVVGGAFAVVFGDEAVVGLVARQWGCCSVLFYVSCRGGWMM